MGGHLARRSWGEGRGRLLFLARSCCTSVAMIDRFYCWHLSALMAPEKIVGMREAGGKVCIETSLKIAALLDYLPIAQKRAIVGLPIPLNQG